YRFGTESTVGINDKVLSRLLVGHTSNNTLCIQTGTTLIIERTDFNRVPTITSCSMLANTLAHFLWLARLDRSDHRPRSSMHSNKQLRYWKPQDLSEHVPTGNIKRCFGVIMPYQGLVHEVINTINLTRIFTQQYRSQLSKS